MNGDSDDRHGADPAVALWADALAAAALLAVDPHGLGGVSLHAAHGPVRERWLTSLKSLMPPGSAWRRMPIHVGDDRLLGGLDLGATLAAGRPVAQSGLLAEADGGIVLVAMAERVGASAAARLCASLDSGEVVLARDGLAERRPARFGVVALDEGSGDDPSPAGALLERMAFRIDLSGVPVGAVAALAARTRAGDGDLEGRDGHGRQGEQHEATAAARARLAGVEADDDVLHALCATADALGVGSARATLLALRAARAAAAADGRDRVDGADAALAARLVLAPRATRWPAPPAGDASDELPEATQGEPEDAPSPGEQRTAEPSPNPAPDDHGVDAPPPPAVGHDDGATDPAAAPHDAPLEDVVLEAARAAIPAGLLAGLMLEAGRVPGAGSGRAGALRAARLRGRPAGTRPGSPRDGARLALVDTLRAAAPWQMLRRRERAARGGATGIPPRRLELRTADLRVARLQERTETTTIFAIDASGSSALHRLAESKGAIELLLADCYVRRDRVAVLAFRGRGADVLLPPTRSLVRAKRSLAGLPGGGGTPLAAGIDAAAALAGGVARRGGTPVVVMLTDGRANVARDGAGGRARADEDARDAARRLRAAGHAVLLVDTSPQPQASAQALAAAMGATYVPLPRADAASIARPVRAAAAGRLGAAGRGR